MGLDDDRAGPLGCGCALLPGLILGLVVFLAVGLMLAPDVGARSGASTSDGVRMSVSLSEEYLGRLVAASLGGGPIEGVEVDARPGNELAVRGSVVVSVLGRELGLPLSFQVRVTLQDEAIRLYMPEDGAPAGMDAAQLASVNPMLLRMAINLQREMERAVGSGWTIEAIETDEDSVVLVLHGDGGAS